MKTKYFYLVAIILTLINISCSSLNIDLSQVNKRSYDIINKEKIILAKIHVKTFETDTALNFKSFEEIKKIYGEPKSADVVYYRYKSPNLLWILEGPLKDIKECTVLMCEWDYPDKNLKRIFIFISMDDKWISISNLLCDYNLND
jgi:hypothetical protein